MQDELGFPDKADQRAEHGSSWTPAELNHILQAHVVDGALSTFRGVEWESNLCRGVMRAKTQISWNESKCNVHTLYTHVYTCYIHIHTCT